MQPAPHAPQAVQLGKDIQEKAERIIHSVFPQKIEELTARFANLPRFPAKPTSFTDDRATQNHTTTNTTTATATHSKKRKAEDSKDLIANGHIEHSSSAVPCDPKELMELMEEVKSEAALMGEMLSTVKLWVQLNVPRIESGNDFGVGVQEEVVSELGRAEDAAFAVIDSFVKFFETRARLVRKMHKDSIPSRDYQRSIVALDEKQHVSLRQTIADLRNNYALLYDLIVKNIDRIRNPRSQDGATMY